MLGRVVVEKNDPLWCFIPDITYPSPRDIVPDIGRDKVLYNDLSRIFEVTRSSSTKARLTKLLEAHATSAASQSVHIESAQVLRYEMTNSGFRLMDLMQDDGYRAQCLRLLDQYPHKRLPMVTGVMTCRNTKVKLDRTNDQGGGVQAQIPIGAATGTSSDADVQGSVDYSRNNADHFQTVIGDEVVFACAYDEVQLQTYLAKKCFAARIFSKPKELDQPTATVTKKIKGEGIKLNFAGDDSQDDRGSGEEGSSLSRKDSFSLSLYDEATD